MTPLSGAILEYITTRRDTKLEAHDKDTEKARKAASDPVALAELERSALEKRTSILQAHLPANWLDDAVRRSKQINLVTHALKYTHSDAKGSSIAHGAQQNQPGLLNSSQLKLAAHDVVGNAAVLDVANLLLCADSDGQPLIVRLAQGDNSALAPFTNDPQQLVSWVDGFCQSIATTSPASHRQAKQLYFPLNDGGYHLLAPLFASALQHALYQRLNEYRFGETAKAAREARKKAEAHPATLHEFRGLLSQGYGGSKPQNISLLNSQRRGRAWLLDSRPPRWHSRTLPPASNEQFWRGLTWRARGPVRELREFLLAIPSYKKNETIRDQRDALLEEIIDLLLQHASQFCHELPPCWSEQTELRWGLRCWLDRGFDRESPPPTGARSDWRDEVSREFGHWLNQQLAHKKMAFGAAEQREWADALHNTLRDRLRRELEDWE